MRDLKDIKRIVVKVGSSTLILANGKPDLRKMANLATVLTSLINEGKQIVLVSSGAVALGKNSINNNIDNSIQMKQAFAAIGQSQLMNLYQQNFANFQQVIAQILLTRDVIEFPKSLENVQNTFETLLKMGVLPIVNENDTTSCEELEHITKFGDNDQLSALVATIIKADLLIILSDIEGFYSDNPNINKNAKMFEEINVIDENILTLAGDTNSNVGTGGMITKLKAAQLLMQNQQQMIIAKGENPQIIYQILNNENIGTLFKQK